MTEWRVGAYFSLSGEDTAFGVDSRDGIELAVDEINKAGGIKKKPMKVLFEDDRDTIEPGDRVVLIEDTRELQCPAPDTVALRTRAGHVGMADLVRSTLRLRPDRIIVGEVRGPEALDMLKAWNTGHPGGIATVHANSAVSALYRLEQLIQEAVVSVPRHLIADAIDLIAFIAGRGLARRVETIARVTGLAPNGDYAVEDITPFTQAEGDVP